MKKRRDSGLEGFSTGGLNEGRDSGLEGYMYSTLSTVDKEGYRKGGFRMGGIRDVEIDCKICFYAYICRSYPKLRQILKQINKLLTRQLQRLSRCFWLPGKVHFRPKNKLFFY